MTPEDVLIPARTSERADFITAPKEEAAAVEIGLNAAIVSMIGGEPQNSYRLIARARLASCASFWIVHAPKTSNPGDRASRLG